WAMYIWSSSSVGRTFPGKEGLVLAMSVGTLLMMPLGVVQAGASLLHPEMLAIGVGVAVVGTVVPYTLEFSALKQLPPKTFGVLMSVEPAIAALVGFLFLGEVLNWQTVLAIAVVTLAAVGATLFGKFNADE
ncbi:EamA family transporter, partial [Leptolyngbya sp. FACHB-36]|uniref:EamA family transporter n=1 Tax=Leptolyngbya sp. FACHB-36 TaxID=2692808 RepID=UPI00168156EC